MTRSSLKRSLVMAVAAAGGLLALPTTASASATRPSLLTQPRTTSYTYVYYGLKNFNTYEFTESADGVTSSGWSAVLFGQVFGTTTPVHYATKALTPTKSGNVNFTMDVTPVLATAYTLYLDYKGKPVGKPGQLGTVYVVQGRTTPYTTSCSTNGTCSVTFPLFRYIPPSAIKAELAKKFYDYLGLTWAASKPPAPKYMTLRTTGVTQSKTTVVSASAHEYLTTFVFTFTAEAASYRYAVDVCTIDSESADGVGLPPSHGCGAKTAPVNPSYLG